MLEAWPRTICRKGLRAGSAAVEFALVLPILIVFFVATAEAVSYLRVWYKLEQASASAASAGSRAESMTTAVVDGLFQAARAVADPHAAWSVGTSLVQARTVISVVTNPTSGNRVSWTCSRGDASLTPRVAGLAALPAGMVVPPGQSVLIVEIINVSVPWLVMAAPNFFNTRGQSPLRAYAVVRPRSAELGTLTGGCP